MKLKLLAIFLLNIPCFIFAQRAFVPWYTGPLIAGDGNNLEKGKVNIQPYLHFRDTDGVYDKAWGLHTEPSTFTFHSLLYFQIGITKFLDITFEAQSFYKDKSKERSFQIGDTSAKLGFQLIKEKDFTMVPSIRLIIGESFPTGKYKNLNPNKLGIDGSGSGSFESIFGLFLQKTVYWFESHPICWRINAIYTYSTDVKVKNFNRYGGGFNTDGKVSPGGVFTAIVAFEFSFTQRWVLAMDFVHVETAKTTFRGIAGTTIDGSVASSSKSSSNQTSLAPAIEYNFSANLGVLAGSHFSIRGKNSTKFKAGVISATYTF